MSNSVVIRPFRIGDITFAASIHFKTITGLSTLLGQSYLRELYKTLVVNPRHVSLAVQADHHLIGFVTATEDIAETSSKLHNLLTLSSYGTLFKKIITFQISLTMFLKRLKFENHQAKSYEKPYLSIVTFCVDRAYQRKGIGSQLIHRIEKEAKKRGAFYIYVDTRQSNSAARSFYRKLGFLEETHVSGNVIFRKGVR